MQRIKQWLNNNEAKEYGVEQGLFIIGMNTFHILSLLWNKTTRKYTNEFLIFKAQETLETFVSLLAEDAEYTFINERITEARDTIKKTCSDVDTMVELIGAEVDSYPGTPYGLSADFKLSFILEALNLIGISDEQIFAKYNN